MTGWIQNSAETNMTTPQKICKCVQVTFPFTGMSKVPLIGPPIRKPAAQLVQYIPERVPITAREGLSKGITAPGRATMTLVVRPQNEAQTTMPATDPTAAQAKRMAALRTRATVTTSNGPYLAAKAPARSRPTTDTPLMIDRRYTSRFVPKGQEFASRQRWVDTTRVRSMRHHRGTSI